MRVLVTGAAGFVGRHMVSELTKSGHEPVVLDQSFPQSTEQAADVFVGDIRDTDFVTDSVASSRTEACIHLAGIAHVLAGKADPPLMFGVNVVGTVNLLEAFRRKQPFARILVVSTAHVYGQKTEDSRIKEDTPLQPVSLYAISKASADMAALAYAAQDGMPIMTARPNNHTGPGQSPDFVVPSLTRQIKAIADGRAQPTALVGNIESTRCFTDVRDVVRAYRLLIEKGQAGKAYNISSHARIRIRELLRKICLILDVKPELKVDPERFRPTDASPNLDTTRIQDDVGWWPEIDLNQTLSDIVAEL